MPEEFFSVSELNQLIKDVLSAGFPRALWVCGEIQNYDRSKDKKHVFFELVEKDPETRDIKARAGLVIWAAVRPRIEAILKKAENAFELKDDIEVKFLCKIDFYSPHGAIRLVVENIDPVYTLGKIAQDRQKLIAELTKSGALQKNKDLEMPMVPLRVGLITAYDSAAHHDFMDELHKSGYGFKVFLARAVMQGKSCEASVCDALKRLDRIDRLDALVITRGGGSIAELSCFDSRAIALAIASSRYPVLTGIGHEINTTVTDLAAHTSAKTPTAIAQVLAGRVMLFLDQMVEGSGRVVELARHRLGDERARLKQEAFGLQARTRELLKFRQEEQVRLIERLRAVPVRLEFKRKEADVLVESLNKTIYLRFQNARTKIAQYRKIMDFASPKKILKRGFSITRTASGALVRDASTLRPQEELSTELAQGRVVSTVQKIAKEE